MLRISLTGPESTGKSTLAARLAAHYGTSFAPEFAREYLAATGPQYTLADLEKIARGQLQAESAATAQARRVVFFDTDLLVIKIWAGHAFGTCPAWISHHLARYPYDLVLLLGVDLPWQPDPLREHPHQRQYFYNLYQRELRAGKSPFAEISGAGDQRFVQACALVDERLRGVILPPVS